MVIILKNKIETFEGLVSAVNLLRNDIYSCIDLTDSLIASVAVDNDCAASDWMAHLQGQAKAYEVAAKKLDAILARIEK